MSTMEFEGSGSGTEFECPNCGGGRVPVHDGGRPTCPQCHESYSAQVGDGFVLVEDDGWVVTLSLPASSRSGQREAPPDSAP